MNRRLTDVKRGAKIAVFLDGRTVEAYEGETVAAVLVVAGQVAFRKTARSGAPRAVYCGMGVCYDCLVIVDGETNQRACMTSVRDGMQVTSQVGWGPPAAAAPPHA